jgi:two-component system alkaline phosphatase synthesis response regulator PhoP
MYKLLIVEDEEVIRSGLALNLSREGYDVLTEEQGDVALQRILSESPDLVLLDIRLPGMNGFEVCRELRHRGIDRPVIMLTAKTEEIDRVTGLEIGADDYVLKPFSIRELEARIRIQLRHSAQRRRSAVAKYRFGEVEIDLKHRHVARQGQRLELTPKEFETLRFMIEHRGEVLSRERMLAEVWGYSTDANTRTLDTHILHLRKKLEADPAQPRYIVSVYGEGYQFKE